MHSRLARRLAAVPFVALVLSAASSCNANKGTAPSLTLRTETFTGTLQPGGIDAKTFTVAFTAAPTELTATVNSLVAINGSRPITGITIGLGFGVPAQSGCFVQLQATAAALGQDLSVPGGVNAGTYCLQISDCPANTTGCSSTLSEPVTDSMTVKHY
jgi:hypothetical protein